MIYSSSAPALPFASPVQPHFSDVPFSIALHSYEVGYRLSPLWALSAYGNLCGHRRHPHKHDPVCTAVSLAMLAAPQRIDILQRHFRRHDIVGHRVYRQMLSVPDSPFLGAVFSDFPLEFTNYLQACRVDNQVYDVPLGRLPIGHLRSVGPPICDGRGGTSCS